MSKGEWCWTQNLVLDRYGRELGPYGIAVYCTLCRFANREQTAFPSQKLIAERIGASRGRVNQKIKQLEGLGLVSVAKRGGCRNVYLLLEPVAYPVDNGDVMFSRGTGKLPDITPTAG